MKRITAVLLVAGLLTGCGHDAWIDGKQYGTYGLFNESTHKNPKVVYEVSVGNVVWSIILIETIIAPVYFVGFSLFNPVGLKSAMNAQENGVIQ